jgi:hypothetical protein
VPDPIRTDEENRAQEKLEAMLTEGVWSGEPTEMTRQDWADIRREALKAVRGAQVSVASPVRRPSLNAFAVGT